MAAPPPEARSHQRQAPEEELGPPTLKLLRELRVEVQDLQMILEKIRKGEASVKVYHSYLQGTVKDIIDLIKDVKDGDSVRHLYNVWEQISVCPLLVDQTRDFPAQEQLQYLNLLDSQCRAMVLQIGIMTIPDRLNDWLRKARPGYYVPFHPVFEDELPIYEDRMRVLHYLAWSPKTIEGGIVDVESGLIYRYSQYRRMQVFSVVGIVAVFILATGLVISAANLPIPEWPLQPQHLSTLIAGWAAVLTGIVVHIAVSTSKRVQAQAGLPPVIALGDALLLLNAKVGQILLKVFLALIGFFGLVFASGISNVTVLNAFLVGYTLDSFVGLFASSIEQRATAQVAAIRQQLGGTAGQ